MRPRTIAIAAAVSTAIVALSGGQSWGSSDTAAPSARTTQVPLTTALDTLPVVPQIDIQTQWCPLEPASVRPAGAGSKGPVPAGRGFLTEWSALRLLAC